MESAARCTHYRKRERVSVERAVSVMSVFVIFLKNT